MKNQYVIGRIATPRELLMKHIDAIRGEQALSELLQILFGECADAIESNGEQAAMHLVKGEPIRAPLKEKIQWKFDAFCRHDAALEKLLKRLNMQLNMSGWTVELGTTGRIFQRGGYGFPLPISSGRQTCQDELILRPLHDVMEGFELMASA